MAMLSGIVTDGDLRRHMAGLLDQTAGEVMTARPAHHRPRCTGRRGRGA